MVCLMTHEWQLTQLYWLCLNGTEENNVELKIPSVSSEFETENLTNKNLL
jgi:hypothetical protein